MILFYARKRYATCSSDDRLTTGSVGIEVVFHFSDDWAAAPARIAVFRGSGVSVDVALLEDSCTVPPEVLTQPGSTLTIGVYGTDGAGTVVIPTVYAEAGRIARGAEPSGIEPTPQTQPLIDQLLAAAKAARDAADEAERLAQSVRDDADAGEFDGKDGNGIWWTVSRITSTGVPGYGEIRASYLKGRSGTPAAHDLVIGPAIGDSGSIAELYEISSVATGTCALKDIGSFKGAPGDPGADGYAPEVTIEQIDGGYRVTITSADYPEGQSFDVMNGQGGGGGITVDDEISATSENPVQNKVIKAALEQQKTAIAAKYTKPSDGIPYNDMSAVVRNRLDSAGIFYATYDVTTAAEIDAAYQAGKDVICVYYNYYLPLAYRSPDLNYPCYVFEGIAGNYDYYHCVMRATLRSTWDFENIDLNDYATHSDVANTIDGYFFKPLVLLVVNNGSLVLNMAMGDQAPSMFINHRSQTLSSLLQAYGSGLHMGFFLSRAMLDGGAQDAFADFRIEVLQGDTDTGTITSLTLSTTVDGKFYWAVLTPISETTMTGTLTVTDLTLPSAQGVSF